MDRRRKSDPYVSLCFAVDTKIIFPEFWSEYFQLEKKTDKVSKGPVSQVCKNWQVDKRSQSRTHVQKNIQYHQKGLVI